MAYCFDAATCTVSVGGVTATMTPNGSLSLPDPDDPSDPFTYERIDYPDAGAVADLALEHIGYSGCSGLPYCSTWTDEFAMSSAGQFIRSESSLATVDVPGGPFTAAGDYPPDSYGTYAVVARGVVEPRFADGHVERKVLGYLTGDDGVASPVTDGVFLGDEYYWVDDD